MSTQIPAHSAIWQVQLPAAQTCPPAHAWSHSPRCWMLVWVSTQLLPQSLPVVQLPEHSPREQRGVAPLHTLPHWPQLSASSLVLMQPLPQWTNPFWQAHEPDTHVVPGGQMLPQLPQLDASLWTETHTPPHCICPAWQPEPPGPFGFADCDEQPQPRTISPAQPTMHAEHLSMSCLRVRQTPDPTFAGGWPGGWQGSECIPASLNDLVSRVRGKS